MIYVDWLMNHGWVLWGKQVMSCHLLCDGDIEELHNFAEEIGLKRSYFHNGSRPHYDLTESKREEAVGNGAIELDRESFLKLIRKK